MSHANKRINKEDKLLVILVIIFVLLGGVYLINKLLNTEDSDSNNYLGNRDNYELISEFEKYKLYKINDYFSSFDLQFDNFLLTYKNAKLFINGQEVVDRVRVGDYVALYDVEVVVVLTNIDTGVNSILEYNMASLTPTVIDRIDGMSIVDVDDINFSEAGINLHISNIVDNQLIIDNKQYDICSYNKNIEVFKNMMYFYDYSITSFRQIDFIEIKKLNQIKKDMC